MNPDSLTNRLSSETSPYLLQHATNPVDWYPWGPEALEKAQKEDKPIFLSIGYSACHWCHVMAHECFENPDIARQMNEGFVNIKVDREERPDVDAIYMKSIMAMTGHGGWPMSVFLTPDQEPYFGGTYFPPQPKFNRPGFPQVLQQARELYGTQKDQLKKRAAVLLEKMTHSLPIPDAKGHSASDLTGATVDILAERFDESHGGFGQGMKFPEPMLYELLLRHWVRTGEDRALQIFDKSLTAMAEGGMYDQLGGGFHRYSTDREWRVPHFEKMLYDNALLARLYLNGYQATKQEIYERIPREVFAYIENEMTSPEGGFYSSQDADTRDGEGYYFTWELKEVLDLLGPRPAQVVARAFGMTAGGNFERRNVPRLMMDPEKLSEAEGMAIFEVDHILKTSRKTLLDARSKREQPGRDEKILCGWNGLMISALALGHRVLGDEAYRHAAERAGELLWNRAWSGDRLKRVIMQGEARFEAMLEDYAYLMEGFLYLYEATFNLQWLERARALADNLIWRFWDDVDGGFFMTPSDHEALIIRLKPGMDEAIPCANAVAAQALLKLGTLVGESDYLEKGRKTIEAFRPEIENRSAAYTAFLAAMDFEAASLTEVVVSGPQEDPEYAQLLHSVYQDFRPNKVVVGYPGAKEEKLIPLSEGRGPVQGKPTVYLCQKQTCHPPVHSAEDLKHLLERPPIIRLNIFDEEGAKKDMEKKEQDQFLNAMSQIFKYSGLKK